MSYLGLDIGEKRIGVAQSDELKFMAHPIGVVERRSNAFAVSEIKKLVENLRIETVVAGLPKTMRGEVGSSASKVLEFVDQLRAELACPVVTWDERLTTVQAERRLLDHDVSRQSRKKKIDAIAAEIMLQSYLDAQRACRSPQQKEEE